MGIPLGRTVQSATINNAREITNSATGYKLAHCYGKKKKKRGDIGPGIVEVPGPNSILMKHCHSRVLKPATAESAQESLVSNSFQAAWGI